MRTRPIHLLLPLLILLITACGGDDDQSAAASEADAFADELATRAGEMGPRAEDTTARGTEWPDTTAQAVWEFLQSSGYAEEWPMWPGTDAYYEGTEPHGMLLTTYLNEAAHQAVEAGDSALPDSSFIVKENYAPDSTLAATTVMYRVSGYDPENGNWFWAKYAADGDVEAYGRVRSCQSCHSAPGDGNFIRTAPL